MGSQVRRNVGDHQRDGERRKSRTFGSHPQRSRHCRPIRALRMSGPLFWFYSFDLDAQGDIHVETMVLLRVEPELIAPERPECICATHRAFEKRMRPTRK